ncbi:phosphoribosyltransferase [Anaeromyxobacter oryzae]|uniref:Phosphoribosyltransferase n=1 Tax=Anaeromyxobacter oryzae TaxID=2918170 RepID=A0ABM7WU39_9BACT|nr:phosphoribosyltransferase family protein [Anaeromyxobacter oryzae]BDG03002.1 phosphoribosyltransferase [Anaeromyxobacter oryzae]
MTFRDRREAGRQLARRLLHLAGTAPVVVAVGPGGFAVAAEIADVLGAELDIRGAAELVPLRGAERSLGAVAERGACLVEPGAATELGVPAEDVERMLAQRRAEAEEHGATCRGGQPPIELAGRNVIVVADGVDGGLSPRAVVDAVRSERPEWLVLATPIADPRHLPALRRAVDELVVLDLPPEFIAVGYWYAQAARPTEYQVAAALAARGRAPAVPTMHGA